MHHCSANFFRLRIFYALLCVLFVFATSATAEDLPIGIVKEKPTSGRFVETPEGYMVPYKVRVPGSSIEFEMVPVPGGTFKMGSPEAEEDRKEDEGPQFDVTIEPFWIAKCEVTWGEYDQFMSLYKPFKSIGTLRDFLTFDAKTDAQKKSIVPYKKRIEPYVLLQTHATRKLDPSEPDAVTTPTPLYDPAVTYDKGDDPELPASTMTQYAAKQYIKWLSGMLENVYRLPCEAEWEYAARAGSKTAYSFGDDPDELEDYGWFFDNSDDTTHPVGEKEPNAWGIHDMHGNVAEWTLDQYVADHFAKFAGKNVAAEETIIWPTKVFPCVIKGGSWGDDADWCRVAKRIRSEVDWPVNDPKRWKKVDPQIPQSPWWYTEPCTQQLGFRIIRPLKPMSDEMKKHVWESEVPEVLADVASKLKEGRGTIGITNRDLPGVIEEVKKMEKGRNERRKR